MHKRIISNKEINLSLNILLTENAYKRIQNLTIIEEVEIQVANPTNILREEYAESSTIKGFAKISNSLNATKSMSFHVKSELKDGGINKKNILDTLQDVLHIGRKTSGLKVSNKFVVKGRTTSEDGLGELVEDSINLFVDRIKGQFSLNEPPILDSVQEHDRRKGITSVYRNKLKEITKIIGYSDSE